MAISHALQPLLLLLLSLFFLPAALGAFVNFTNCGLSNIDRGINATSVRINPYPLGIGENATFTITANSTINITAGNIELDTYTSTTVPLVLHRVRKTYSLCNVTACPVTPGLIVFNFPIVIPRNNRVTNQSEYFAIIRMYENIIYQTMCFAFTYPTRKP
ncbi:unnamed protein product [Brassica rapa]|uniref:MD-2-related lipid-recognition domain-containing protein n=1 Tax=Brassica campestris TaxID=3711 RepID=A0A3P5YGF9_BRACM|nr:unnamed protein product [Brassica rapa]VDC60540.1 unnamed protein product [Brassica rapa]